MRQPFAPMLLVAGACFAVGFAGARAISGGKAAAVSSAGTPPPTGTISPLPKGGKQRALERLETILSEGDGTVLDRYRRLLEFIRDAKPSGMAATVRTLEAEVGNAPGGRELVELAYSKWGEADPLRVLGSFLAGETRIHPFVFDPVRDPFAPEPEGGFPEETGTSVGDLAAWCMRHQPEAAWEAVLRCPNRGLRGTMIGELLIAELDIDPALAARRLLTLEAPLRYQDDLVNFLEKLTLAAPAHYIELHPRLPMRLRTGTELAFVELAKQDPVSAASRAIDLPGEGDRSLAISGTLTTWLTDDPGAARQWWRAQASADHAIDWEGVLVEAHIGMGADAAANWRWEDALEFESTEARANLIEVLSDSWPPGRWRETVAAMEHVQQASSVMDMMGSLPAEAWRELPLEQLAEWFEDYAFPNNEARLIYKQRREGEGGSP